MPFVETPAFVLAFVGVSADFELLIRVDAEVRNASCRRRAGNPFRAFLE
jgi:hypothetical protein